MADVATPPAAEGKQQIVKPEKPDDDKYKEDLAKAEKEHTAAQDKLVGQRLFYYFGVMRYTSGRSMPTGTRIASKLGPRVAHADMTRTPAKPSSTSPARTTKTRPTESASRS